jgi:CBS domain-containing protein
MASIKRGGDKEGGADISEAHEQDRTAGRLDVEAESRFAADPGLGAERGVRVEEVMSTDLVTAAPSTSLAEAARLMRDNDVGFLPICDSEGSVVGVLTDRDLVIRAMAQERPNSTRVEDLMSEDLAVCHAGDDLADCERLMRANMVSRIIVLGDDERLAGVVSLADLANRDEDDERLGGLLSDVKTSDLGR